MRKVLVVMLMVGLVGFGAGVGSAAIYSQDFESGYSDGDQIGTRSPWDGSDSTHENVDDVAARSGSFGWNFYPYNVRSSMCRAYDSNTFGPLTQDDSFTLEFWIYNAIKGNSAANIGWVGMFDTNETERANGTALKSSININLGGAWIDNDRRPAYALHIVTSEGTVHQQSANDAYIIDGFQKWYRVVIQYDSSTRVFDYKVYDESDVVKITDSWTLPTGETFTVNAFGGYDGTATDGRSMRVYVDDVSIVPEPATIGLLCMGVIGLLRKK